MIEIEVTYNDHSQGYFPINPREGWRVNPAQRCLVIGHGVPRIHVPLDNVLYFTLLPGFAPARWHLCRRTRRP